MNLSRLTNFPPPPSLQSPDSPFPLLFPPPPFSTPSISFLSTSLLPSTPSPAPLRDDEHKGGCEGVDSVEEGGGLLGVQQTPLFPPSINPTTARSSAVTQEKEKEKEVEGERKQLSRAEFESGATTESSVATRPLCEIVTAATPACRSRWSLVVIISSSLILMLI